MRWEDERYVRLYTRKTVTWKLLPWQAKALLPLLLREVDRAGIMDLDAVDPVEAVAAMTDMPPEMVGPGLSALMKAGVVKVSPSLLVMPKFLEAQEAVSSDAQRKRDQRERDRARAEDVTPRDAPVTLRDQVSQNVTSGHAESRAVTPSLTSLTSLTEPVKETVVEQGSTAPEVQRVFDYWKEKLDHPRAQLDPKRAGAIKARLKGKRTPEELMRAVDGCALTPHNMGQNDRGEKYDDIELICRTDGHVERFIRNATDPPKANGRDWTKGRVGAEEIDKMKLAVGDLSNDF